jgi:hypothetical protein
MKCVKPAFVVLFILLMSVFLFFASTPRNTLSKEKKTLEATETTVSVDDKSAKTSDEPSPVIQREEGPKGYSVPITLYNQKDPAWSNYLYGGMDPMATHGCGPTALAIVVSSLSDTPITPVDAAEWSAANGCYSPDNGSVHRLIPAGSSSYGLRVEKLSPLTPDTIRLALSFDKLLVLLMGPGDFSDSGHFIVAYGYDESGAILVADPASQERSSQHWSADTLISQLSAYAQDGGPVWVISKP